MDKPMNKLLFGGMSFIFGIRDLIRTPEKVLAELRIAPGFRVIDYGCGPGAFSIAAARLVGESGKVYAVDIHPAAIRSVQKRASKKGLTNIEAVCADSPRNLESESVDVVLLYDIFHMLGDRIGTLKELHRTLKSNGILSFSDHHMNQEKILSEMTKSGLFKLTEKGRRTYSFSKVIKNG